jgi:hypothetical protein
MKVRFADSFIESLERLITHQTWWYKTYEFIRWDIWRFFSNVWKFRKELYNHRWWDYQFTLEMLERSLIIMEKGMHTGLEVRESRDKKIQKMQRAIQLIQNVRMDTYIEQAEAELGKIIHHDWQFEEVYADGFSELVDKNTPEEKKHNQRVFQRSHEIEKEEWKELWEIFKGTKYSKKYGKKYDGTDMRSWWD